MGQTHEKGQVLLVVVLIMVVALTVGLSVVSRSINNLKIATDDENSQRAFSAAEAGVERALKSSCTDVDSGCPIVGDFTIDNSTRFTTVATPISGTQFLVKGGIPLKQDEGADVWLSDYSADASLRYGNPWSGNVTVYWGDSPCNPGSEISHAALNIMVLHGSKGDPQLTQYAYDPCFARRGANNFTQPSGSGTVNGKSFAYSATIPILDSSSGLIMKVIPLYTNAVVGIKGPTAFPIQGQQIDSSGNSGGTVRKVTFVQSYSSLPVEFFQYVLMSPQ